MVAVRVASADEVQFLTSVKQGVWASSTGRFKHWQIDDLLVIVVDRAIAGIAKVVDKPFVSESPLWDGGSFPHRISVEFVYAIAFEVRPPLYGEVAEALTAAWGQRYGWAMANQRSLPADAAEIVLDAVQMRPNDLANIRVNIDIYLEKARQNRYSPKLKMLRPGRLRVVNAGKKQGKTESTIHLKAQHDLIRLGRVTGCSVWVASNDRSRVYQGQPLSQACLSKLPNLGLPKEASDRVALIDVIWIRRNMPLYAFEVEVTSTVYSGILRMSDLVALVPLLNVHLFVVAPLARRDKVLRELARPTFEKIGLRARFIALEDLGPLLAKVEQLGGHIQPSVVETIAFNIDKNYENMLR